MTHDRDFTGDEVVGLEGEAAQLLPPRAAAVAQQDG